MRTLTLVAVAVAVAACADSADAPADATQSMAAPAPAQVHQAVALTPEQAQGKVIFESVCWTCHGSGGHGNGPAKSDNVAPPTFHTQDYLQASPGTLMQRFRASMQGDDPSHPHMQYVAKLVNEESFSAAVSYIPALVYPVEVTGSALHGQDLFEYRCAGCHGVGGLGDGPGAAALADIKPVDFTTDTLVASTNWDAVFAKVKAGGDRVHGSTMPAWSLILSDDDIWDLVAYLATFQPGLVAAPSWSN